MKQIYTLLILLFTVTYSQAQIVNIPDANFRNALVNDIVADFDGDGSFDGDVDTNNDGEIQVSEAVSVMQLNLNSKGISSLVGIHEFINLSKLTCVSNNISALDVSNNLLLAELNCSFNHVMSSLILGVNTNLTKLICDTNDLTSLDVSQIPNLIELGCEFNVLTSLDVSLNPALQKLRFRYNQLTSIDVANNMNLISLDCSENLLGTLDVSQNIYLEVLQCDNNSLVVLDLTNNLSLTYLTCNYNSLTFLNIKNTSFETTLSFSNNPTLEAVCADTSQLPFVQNLIYNYLYASCSLGDDCVVLSNPNYELDTSLEIFPNPIKNNLTIKGNNNLKSIAVYDVNGRLLQEVSFIGNQLERIISLSDLDIGMYFVKVISSKGQLVKQIVKG